MEKNASKICEKQLCDVCEIKVLRICWLLRFLRQFIEQNEHFSCFTIRPSSYFLFFYCFFFFFFIICLRIYSFRVKCLYGDDVEKMIYMFYARYGAWRIHKIMIKRVYVTSALIRCNFIHKTAKNFEKFFLPFAINLLPTKINWVIYSAFLDRCSI